MQDYSRSRHVERVRDRLSGPRGGNKIHRYFLCQLNSCLKASESFHLIGPHERQQRQPTISSGDIDWERIDSSAREHLGQSQTAWNRAVDIGIHHHNRVTVPKGGCFPNCPGQIDPKLIESEVERP
jgi:hypothetical protein